MALPHHQPVTREIPTFQWDLPVDSFKHLAATQDGDRPWQADRPNPKK